jgi:hypothetical protein
MLTGGLNMTPLVFIILCSFFLGGIVRSWINEEKLDVWDKIGLVTHPIAITICSLAILNKG